MTKFPDVRCYADITTGDRHRVFFSIPDPSGKGRILKETTITARADRIIVLLDPPTG
jgi:hypothetical protein